MRGGPKGTDSTLEQRFCGEEVQLTCLYGPANLPSGFGGGFSALSTSNVDRSWISNRGR